MNKRILAALMALALLFAAAALAEDALGGVAGEADMTDVADIVPEGMQSVTADQLNAGTYAVNVDSSSSMFKILGCELTVAEDGMTAQLIMKSDAYSYMYPGSAEEAAAADLAELAPLETAEDGSFRFTLPVDALDAGYTCAAFSARKQLWYPRTLLFRADSLPLSAWRTDSIATVESLDLADGAYTCAVALEGAGRAALESPAALTVSDGACVADIVFSTSRIDYVIVDGAKYEPVSTEGGAAFRVPVAAFGQGLSIIVDSTAIKPAVEVAYTMTFDPDTIEKR